MADGKPDSVPRIALRVGRDVFRHCARFLFTWSETPRKKGPAHPTGATQTETTAPETAAPRPQAHTCARRGRNAAAHGGRASQDQRNYFIKKGALVYSRPTFYWRAPRRNGAFYKALLRIIQNLSFVVQFDCTLEPRTRATARGREQRNDKTQRDRARPRNGDAAVELDKTPNFVLAKPPRRARRPQRGALH